MINTHEMLGNTAFKALAVKQVWLNVIFDAN